MGKGILVGETVYLRRLGQRLPAGGSRPLVTDYHPEIHHGQNGHQGPSHMAAAEQIHSAGAAERLGIQGHIVFYQPGTAAQGLGSQLSGDILPTRYGAIFVPQSPAPAAFPVNGGDEPGLPAAVHQGQYLLRQGKQRVV